MPSSPPTPTLQRTLRHQIRSPRDEIVDDACQFAWTILVRLPDVDLRGTGFAWLRTVAVNEARRLCSTAHETPAGAFLAQSDLQHERGEMAEPADIELRGADEQALAHIEQRERKQALQALKPRERQALYLKGVGYSYQEIMRLTDSTYTAVNRRIAEGRAALRRHMGDEGARAGASVAAAPLRGRPPHPALLARDEEQRLPDKTRKCSCLSPIGTSCSARRRPRRRWGRRASGRASPPCARRSR